MAVRDRGHDAAKRGRAYWRDLRSFFLEADLSAAIPEIVAATEFFICRSRIQLIVSARAMAFKETKTTRGAPARI